MAPSVDRGLTMLALSRCVERDADGIVVRKDVD
jgi:hypothetical protein